VKALRDTTGGVRATSGDVAGAAPGKRTLVEAQLGGIQARAPAAGAGAPLPAPVQKRFEASLGSPLDGVRVHTGPASAAAADAVGARAFAFGQDIHFSAGEYDPGSASGQRLLAHEVAHTVQQGDGAPVPQHQLRTSTPGDRDEREADAAADAMMAGQRAHVTAGSPTAIGRVMRAVTAERIAEVDAARAEVKLEVVDTRTVEYLNPELLRYFAVKRGGGLRRAFLSKLKGLLYHRSRTARMLDEIRDELADVRAQQRTLPEMGPLTKKDTRRSDKLDERERALLARGETLIHQFIELGAKVKAETKRTRDALIAHFEAQRATDQARADAAARGVERAEDKLAAERERNAPDVYEGVRLRIAILDSEIALLSPGPERITAEARRSALDVDLAGAASMLTEDQRDALPPAPAATKDSKELHALRARLAKVKRRIASGVRDEGNLQNKLDKAETQSARAERKLELLDRLNDGLPLTVELEVRDLRATLPTDDPADADGVVSVDLHAVNPGINVDHPEGFKEGGSIRISESVYEAVAARLFKDDPDAAAVAPAILQTFAVNEGRADSMNTWDRAGVTMGPGIAALGVLQRVFARLKEQQPDDFDRLVGRYGVDMVIAKGKNPRFSVIVGKATGHEVGDKTWTPGQQLVGDDAIEYMASDPLLLAVLRHAGGDPVMQELMVEAVARTSIEAAVDFRVHGGGASHRLRDLLDGVDRAVVTGALAALADEKHGTGNLQKARAFADAKYAELAEEHGFDPARPGEEPAMPQDARAALGHALLERVPERRRKAFRTFIGDVFAE
jgi:hypothetical protein